MKLVTVSTERIGLIELPGEVAVVNEVHVGKLTQKSG
jgi:hypothetical protein